MDQKNINHEDDVMTAFENLKKSIDSLDGTNGAADMKASAHTQVITPTKKDGVIDRAEWDRMLAEIDAKNAKEKEMAAAAEEENKAEEVVVETKQEEVVEKPSKKEPRKPLTPKPEYKSKFEDIAAGNKKQETPKVLAA